MAAVRHSEFRKYAHFNISHDLQQQSACSCKISSRSVERLRKYSEFSISNTAAMRHPELLKYANFTFHFVCGPNLHVRAIFHFDERLRRYSEYSLSNMVAVRHIEFRKYANFNISHGLKPQSTCSGKISLQSL